MKQALLIVDMQNDYFAGGRMRLQGMEEAAEKGRLLLQHFRALQAPLYHLQHLATREGASFFLPDTVGCQIHPLLQPEAGEPVLVKHFPSAFRDTGLHQRLQTAGIGSLLICGAMSHMCIDSTVRAAFDLGYSCTVIADACATRDLEFAGHQVKAVDVHAAFMAALQLPFARVCSTSEWLDAL